MCLHGSKDDFAASPPWNLCKLSPRKCPPMWNCMLWSPLEILMVSTTMALGFAAAVALPTRLDIPVPGSMAALTQGVLTLLHVLVEGPRLQVLPVYLATVLLAVGAAAGGFGDSAGLLAAMGVATLGLASCSLLLCYHLPRVLPVGGRGPYAVGIATEHIRTPVAAAGDDAKSSPSEEELWPLELMAQVFYPVERSCVAKLPWFPSSIKRFRRSLCPATGEANRWPFGLTQMGVVGASIVLGLEDSLRSDGTPSLGDLLRSVPSWSSLAGSAHAWTVSAAVALCLVCLVSDLRRGLSRSAYQTRYLAREQARYIAKFSKMPGFFTEHLCGFYGAGFESGHFHAPGVPCFPAAPVVRGEAKRPMVIFSHGLGGNRSMYAEHGAAYAAQGYVAVLLEHNDGSGSSCMFPDGRITPYAKAPNLKDVGAPDNHAFRLAQLRRRGREIQLTRAHLAKLARGSATDLEACRLVGLGDVIDTKRPAFVGHSFGGGTVLQVLSDERERVSRGGAEMDPEETGYSMAFIMDAWTFPCSEEARAQSVDIPLVVITNDGFLGAEGKKNEERLVDNAVRMVRDGANDLTIQLRVKDAGHTNFSDSPLFAPGPLRKLQGAGDIDCVMFIDQVNRLALCALEIFLRRRTSSGDAVKTPAPSDLVSVVLGEDLAVAFPEARVKRVCAGGVMPSPRTKTSSTVP
ncbi:unnamed protein product [Ectocarpus sp. CCAP 1310/34]|nr:unnamed protein product [Ectocarpus sp. CCAP 1310/34]